MPVILVLGGWRWKGPGLQGLWHPVSKKPKEWELLRPLCLKLLKSRVSHLDPMTQLSPSWTLSFYLDLTWKMVPGFLLHLLWHRWWEHLLHPSPVLWECPWEHMACPVPLPQKTSSEKFFPLHLLESKFNFSFTAHPACSTCIIS